MKKKILYAKIVYIMQAITTRNAAEGNKRHNTWRAKKSPELPLLPVLSFSSLPPSGIPLPSSLLLFVTPIKPTPHIHKHI